jgi:hypothetical protein
MSFVNRLGDFPDVPSRFALGSNGMGVNLGSIPQRQTPLGVLQVMDLRQ